MCVLGPPTQERSSEHVGAMAAALAASEEQRECAHHAEAFFLWMARWGSHPPILPLCCSHRRFCTRHQTENYRGAAPRAHPHSLPLSANQLPILELSQESVLDEHLASSAAPGAPGAAAAAPGGTGRQPALAAAAQHVQAVSAAAEARELFHTLNASGNPSAPRHRSSELSSKTPIP